MVRLNLRCPAVPPTIVIRGPANAYAHPLLPRASRHPTHACNRIDFRGDVNHPGWNQNYRRNSFVKTWRLRNDGSCTWTTAYDLAFVDGDRMGAPTSWIPKQVKPGESIDISVS